MTVQATAPPFLAPGHNHGRCLETAMARAAAAFEARGLKLTDLRRRVLTEIASSHRAVGAYDVLERLAAKGHRLAPISVYRAIDALIAAGVVHRLESRNAFFACHCRHGGAEHLVLACEGCGMIAEVDSAPVFAAIDAVSAAAGFRPKARVVEVAGRCANCGGDT
jgi:Fur family transcriptional regulator, zinc uptake regulator